MYRITLLKLIILFEELEILTKFLIDRNIIFPPTCNFYIFYNQYDIFDIMARLFQKTEWQNGNFLQGVYELTMNQFLFNIPISELPPNGLLSWINFLQKNIQ